MKIRPTTIEKFKLFITRVLLFQSQPTRIQIKELCSELNLTLALPTVCEKSGFLTIDSEDHTKYIRRGENLDTVLYGIKKEYSKMMSKANEKKQAKKMNGDAGEMVYYLREIAARLSIKPYKK